MRILYFGAQKDMETTIFFMMKKAKKKTKREKEREKNEIQQPRS